MKGETPQARGGSPHSPRKAVRRSETERPIYALLSTKQKGEDDVQHPSPHPHQKCSAAKADRLLRESSE
ncbi:hypothetical protein, partial [Rossellomorea marisflavi]|uniref:hypothetical protein n=1 Tax=Rossellomorea marisflavi TaxID=189381 RepID=UPI001CA33702